jgi:hypothetical protein
MPDDREIAAQIRREVYILWVFGAIALATICGLAWSVFFPRG